MRVYRSLHEARQAGLRDTIATLGVFDGVHIGHRYVIRECVTLALERSAESVVVTFVQHPRAVIAGRAPKLITSIEHRFRLFEGMGVDHVLALVFDETIRERPALDFAHEVFEDILGARIVVLGHNCRFGRDREGSAEFLAAHAREFRFEARRADEIRVGAEILSSTVIRKAIESGDLEGASRMLGRPFSIFGTVVEGDARGRLLGFPTANLDPHHELLPPNGVYGGRARVAEGEWYALVNVGRRPTFGGGAEIRIEAHLLDFEGNLYGRDMELVFLTKLRDEMKFSGPQELEAQIRRDQEAFRRQIGASPRKLPRLD